MVIIRWKERRLKVKYLEIATFRVAASVPCCGVNPVSENLTGALSVHPEEKQNSYICEDTAEALFF